jgi:hypothetical protein
MKADVTCQTHRLCSLRQINFIFSLLALAGTAAAGECLKPGSIQLLWQGTMELPAGNLYNLEKDLNIIQGSATYDDGTVKQSEMHQEGWQGGVYGEYTLTRDFGAQIGIDFRAITQKVSVGGGSYEERVLAEGTLLRYDHPFLGASYYLANEEYGFAALTARAGGVLNGTLFPVVTDYKYLGLTPQGYALTGYTLGAGLSAAIVYDWAVIGASFFVTDNVFRTSEKIYQNLDASFSTMSYDLQIMVGFKL